MKRYICGLLVFVMILSLLPCTFVSAAPADLGAMVSDMPTGQNLFLTLYNGGDSGYRWNVSGIGEKNSDLHLYNVTGSNCNFKLYSAGSSWYGIKFMKDNGVDRYVDVADKSTAEGKALHIWESSDDKLTGNNHRLFAFYKAGTDAQGNQLYYIKVRHSMMWIGVENNSVTSESKIVQTATNPRKWYVTPCVVPNKANESQPWTNSTGLYCELFARNTMQSVSIEHREGNLETDGMDLDLYTLGQTTRWLLKYNSTYKAYEIASTKYSGSDGLGVTGRVWDTESEGADTPLHIWTSQSKAQNENTAQLWRFLKNSDGSYYIYNARSGKFVCIDGSKLVQGERSAAQAFILSPLSTNSTHVYGSLFGSTAEPLNWMKSIPDTALLSEVNLPGTHDTGAMAVVQDMSGTMDNLSITKCQKYYFEEQLATGVRSFDIRCNATANSATVDDVMIIHGNSLIQCYDRYGAPLSLGSLLYLSQQFLKSHPTETILFMVKPDDGTHQDLARTLKDYIDRNPDLFWQSNNVPTMRQARGKIVLTRRFEASGSYYTNAFGPDLSKWDDQDYASVKGLIKLPGNTGSTVYIQDAYQQTGSAKKEYITGALNQSSSVPKDAYIYNYTSCTLGLVIDTTRDINPWLYGQNLNGMRLGTVMLNYADLPLNQKIYKSNQFASPAVDTAVTIRHSLNLESDISINYLVPEEQLSSYESFYLSCSVPQYTDGVQTGTVTKTLNSVLKSGYYIFTLEGLTAIQMGDRITAKLHMERYEYKYCTNEDLYSIADYAYSQMSKDGSTQELKALCAQLLVYGSYAQLYKGYRTDALCDSLMTDAHKSYLTDLSAVTFGNHNRQIADLEAPTVLWAGKGINMDTRIQLLFVMDPKTYGGNVADLTLHISYEDIYGNTHSAVLTNPELYLESAGYYAFTFSDLLASELRQVVTVAVYAGNEQVSKSLQYSVDTYGNGKTGNLATLCKGMIA